MVVGSCLVVFRTGESMNAIGPSHGAAAGTRLAACAPPRC